MDLVPAVGYVPCGAKHLQLSLPQRKAAGAWHPAAGPAVWPGSTALPGQPVTHKFLVWSHLLLAPAAERLCENQNPQTLCQHSFLSA